MSVADQTLCLAALLQHCRLVDQLAISGSVDYEELGNCLQQLFVFDHQETRDAFGDHHTLQPGLRLLQDILNRKSGLRNQMVLQYAVALLHLERKLSRKPELLQIIRSRLEHASFRNSHFASDSQTITENIAGIYQDTLSTLPYRIHVKGNMQHLQDEHTANCIRALLLCAVRAVRLWRMSGGSRLKLLMGRSQYVRCAQQILSTA